MLRIRHLLPVLGGVLMLVLAACGDSRAVLEVAGHASCRVVTYGLGEHNDVHPSGKVEADLDGSHFEIVDASGTTEIVLPHGGDHNVQNALAVWAVARFDGLPRRAIAEALAGFTGVRRRMEELATHDGITVVDDFAHHPTAIGATLDALRAKYHGRRLVVAFEPRSLTAARAFLFDDYCGAFRRADRVFLAPVFHADRLSDEERLDTTALVAEVRALGVAASTSDSVDDLESNLLPILRRGDVVVTMSSGSFEGLPHRLVKHLSEQA